MNKKAYKPMTIDELVEALDVDRSDRDRFRELLDRMEREGDLVRTRSKRYGPPRRMNLEVGQLQGHEKGYAFLIPDEPGRGDVFVGPESLNGAMHGDRVVVRLEGGRRKSGGRTAPARKVEGEVIRVLKRANREVVGTYERNGCFGFVTPDDKRLVHDVFIPREESAGAQNGEKVVVEITRWPERHRNPEGRVAERLGGAGDPGVDILCIMRKYGLNEEFPPEVERELERVPDEVRPTDVEGRRDLRRLPTVTIDGADARDLDDAVSLERPDGQVRWRLGVHIADVSHYVPEGSALDLEARARGTSVYLVDRAVPMLPPKLSNGICSLNPGVDRLAVSVFMDFDDSGRLLGHEIFRSVIRSDHRMTYDEVATILAGQDEGIEHSYRGLVPTFREMAALCEVLSERRSDRGALDFDFPEDDVVLDDDGKPVEIVRRRRTIADRIIEEFMLACNETIARRFSRIGAPFLYRVHEEPEPDAIESLRRMLKLLGYRLPRGGRIEPAYLQALLEEVRDTRHERVVSAAVLRALQRARYAAMRLEHFGLATDCYTHFTSPIRRYPDLIVHRIVKEVLDDGRLSPERREALEEMLPGVASHSSERESKADEAERETIDLKKTEFMADKVGEVFSGVISGVTPFGIYVELENGVEGLVHVSNMTDDYYQYREETLSLVGERTRRRYRIGDQVTVQVWKVDVGTRRVELGLVQGRRRKRA